ncbi:MAG: hypothetical protein EBT04_13315 [Betaproteobacteria bacterium]|nr:hypothetical protein [Betaproteobacteria bacterium]
MIQMFVDPGPIRSRTDYNRLQLRWRHLVDMDPEFGSAEWVEMEVIGGRLNDFDLGEGANDYGKADNDDSFKI